MLVFTRRRDQVIVIGDGIEIRVLRVGRDGVRLGVVAPQNVPVHRQEIYEQIREANRTAAEIPGERLSAVAELLKRGPAAPAPAAAPASASTPSAARRRR